MNLNILVHLFAEGRNTKLHIYLLQNVCKLLLSVMFWSGQLKVPTLILKKSCGRTGSMQFIWESLQTSLSLKILCKEECIKISSLSICRTDQLLEMFSCSYCCPSGGMPVTKAKIHSHTQICSFGTSLMFLTHLFNWHCLSSFKIAWRTGYVLDHIYVEILKIKKNLQTFKH